MKCKGFQRLGEEEFKSSVTDFGMNHCGRARGKSRILSMRGQALGL